MVIDEAAASVFDRYVAAEYAYFTPKGEPLCWPVTPYWYPQRQTLAIATGLAYPNKADYAKRNPKVALLFSDATSSGLTTEGQILVQADAHVHDEDIQANTDRYVRELRAKFPAARLAINGLTVRRLDFYLPRLWVDLKPVALSRPQAAERQEPGHGEVTSHGMRPPDHLRDTDAAILTKTMRRFDDLVVTVKGSDGYPAMLRSPFSIGDGEVVLAHSPGTGPACLTLHRHTLRGLRFHAYMVRGNIYHQGSFRFVPKRLVGFFGNGAVFPLSAIPAVKDLRRNLHSELSRRGQPMPQLRIP